MDSSGPDALCWVKFLLHAANDVWTFQWMIVDERRHSNHSNCLPTCFATSCFHCCRWNRQSGCFAVRTTLAAIRLHICTGRPGRSDLCRCLCRSYWPGWWLSRAEIRHCYVIGPSRVSRGRRRSGDDLRDDFAKAVISLWANHFHSWNLDPSSNLSIDRSFERTPTSQVYSVFDDRFRLIKF